MHCMTAVSLEMSDEPKLGQNEAFLGLEYKVYFLYLNF